MADPNYTPTVVTIITMLTTTVIAFLRGTVVSGTVCEKREVQLRADFDKRLAQEREDFEERIAELHDRVRVANERADQLMQLAMQATGAAEDLITVAKNRSVQERGRKP